MSAFRHLERACAGYNLLDRRLNKAGMAFPAGNKPTGNETIHIPIREIKIQEGLRAELVEIDGNFVRRDLSGNEFGDLLLQRKAVYESLHPETKNGGDRRNEKIRNAKCNSDDESAPCHGLRTSEAELEEMLYNVLSKQAQVILNMGSLEEAGTLEILLAKQAEYVGKVGAYMGQNRTLYERFVLRELNAEGYKAQKGTIDSELNRISGWDL